MLRTVVEWNSYADNHPSDVSLTEVYFQLTKAEYIGSGEFLEGFHTHDDEMILDGIADLTYTSFFWAATEGMGQAELKDLFEHAKVCANFGGATYVGTVNLLDHYLTQKDSSMFVKELIVLMLILQDKYDLLGSFEAVSVSNMSKFPKVGDVESPDLEMEIILGSGRYCGLGCREFNGRYIFTAMEDLQDKVRFDKPKIIKSGQFKEVVGLTQFIY